MNVLINKCFDKIIKFENRLNKSDQYEESLYAQNHRYRHTR